MRVVVTGATGNVGTSVVEALAMDPSISSIRGIARRVPTLSVPKTEFVRADVARDDLVSLFEGADAVVHLAWRIQPARRAEELWETNVAGSRRVLDAVRRARVEKLVYASSVGAYSPRRSFERVDESWPTEGIPSSHYSRQKAAVERELDAFERIAPSIAVVRLRPGLIFKAAAASEIKRYFIGPLVPRMAFEQGFIRFVPRLDRLRFQVVHSKDVGHAYRLAVVKDVRGAFNIAADPILDSHRLAAALDARELPVSAVALRLAASVTFRLHLQRTDPGWVDLALSAPLMDTSRATRELGFEPKRSAIDTLLELLAGLRAGRGLETPPLEPLVSGRLAA
jgi:nucleoside-diphosphate-sugar epimerase